MGSIYDAALGYEIAFGYRDIPDEVDALLIMAGTTPASILEIAAGPAGHAVECARRGFRATALDRSAAMCARAGENAAAAGVSVEVVRADMRDFTVADPVDLAFCMISSISHVLTLDDMIAHLRAVRAALATGGCYIIEGSHPTDYLGAKSVETSWDSERDGITVRLAWGCDGDTIDPVTQQTRVRVTLTMTGPDGTARSVETIEDDRFWTPDEMRAAARLAGMRVTAEYGGFDGIPLTDPKAWRMISVLRPHDEA